LRHLLSLKAGLDTDVTHMARSKDSATGMGPEEMARSLVRVRPSGIIMGYEDMGTGLLGIVLQEVDGKPYREVIRDRILVPLGMTRTVVGLPDDRVADVSRCHEITSHGELKFCEHQLLRDLAKGAGDLSTTAGDMAIFLKALANKAAYPGGSLLQPETFGQFTDVDQNRFHPQMPGFGLLVAEDGPLGRGGVGFGGGIAGFVTIFFVSLSDGVGVFVGLNAIPGQFSEAMSRNLTGLFNFITAPPPAPKTVAALNSMFVILELTNDFFARFLEGGEVEAVTTSAAGGPPLIGAPDLAMLSGRYIPIHAVSFGSFIGRFAAGLLFPVTRVEVTRDNALTIGNGGPYEQTLPSLFEDSEARDRVAFKITGEGVLMARLSPRTTGGLLIKLAWHDNPLINILPGGIFMIILLAAAVPAAGGRGPTRRLGRLAFGSAAIFVICLMLEMEFATRVIRVEGWPLVAALWRLPLQVAVIGFAALPVLAVIHRRQVQALAGNWGRGYLLALGLSGAGLAVLAGYWGLIGNLTGN
ncbi:MAG: serine hydrolase domain-containing protein, partial [Rhodospirillales bacterium]|nr:serine hydrolase domain-containing protein [Rhodospirillales bacterium]